MRATELIPGKFYRLALDGMTDFARFERIEKEPWGENKAIFTRAQARGAFEARVSLRNVKELVEPTEKFMRLWNIMTEEEADADITPAERMVKGTPSD